MNIPLSTIPSADILQAAQLRRLASISYERGLYVDARNLFLEADLLETRARDNAS